MTVGDAWGHNRGFPVAQMVKKQRKKPACNVAEPDSIPGSGRSPGERNGNPLQHSCLENPVDRGARQNGEERTLVPSLWSF